MKTCSKCKLLHEDDYFSRCAKAVSGLQSQCKNCKRLAATMRKEKYLLENRGKKYPYYKKSKEARLKDYNKSKLHHNISRLIRKGLKLNKNGNTFDLLGYTQNELKVYIESKFKEGMSWDNYGINGWHIDHIIPRSSLPYEFIEDDNFKKCWSLNNLQPLWAVDNLKKSNKL